VVASFSPRREIPQLAVFAYPGGVKEPNAERITISYGRRSKQVNEPPFHLT
jgi:hypothetical protein